MLYKHEIGGVVLRRAAFLELWVPAVAEPHAQLVAARARLVDARKLMMESPDGPTPGPLVHVKP